MSRTCMQCGDRLPVTLRRDARFCGGACRVASHRARRAREAQPVPECMTKLRRWVRWRLVERGGKATKVPVRVSGRMLDVNNRDDWQSFEQVRASSMGDGYGIVLGDGLGCIDLDDCFTDGVLAPWAQEIVDGHRAEAIMVERSFSGNGVHIFLPMPEGPGRRIRDGVRNIEIYSRGRYIAVTGDLI